MYISTELWSSSIVLYSKVPIEITLTLKFCVQVSSVMSVKLQMGKLEIYYECDSNLGVTSPYIHTVYTVYTVYIIRVEMHRYPHNLYTDYSGSWDEYQTAYNCILVILINVCKHELTV